MTTHESRGDETRESGSIREGVVAGVMVGFFAFVVLAALGLTFFYRSLAPNPTFVTPNVFPTPRLQTEADGLRDSEIARQQAGIKQFRWIDRAHGVFQIPIDRAMKLVAARGSHAYDPIPPPNGGPAQ